ncbi:MAG: ROK family transcriptional regulator [Humibacillus sp.]|nr:ROK family transcriptional regulator [Humibacillus sp.]MDN5775825.1 ROK family transcriptional regulator [Humibacillus sp.]
MSTPTGVGAYAINRGQLIDAIRRAGRISRVELVHQMGSNAATVSTAVRSLIDDGLVVEVGRAASTGGKPAVLLSVVRDARFALGVSLDHSGISYVVANLGGAVVGRLRRRGAGADTPAAVVERIAAEITSLVTHVGVDPALLLGLGVVSPGPITGANGMALTPPVMQSWRDFPLAESLEASTGLTVLVENDASAATMGEYWSGTAGTSRTFATLYMGTGIGAGFMIDGIVHRGVSGNTGEIGHICIDLDGLDCWCGARGCVETVAAPTALVTEARARGLALPGLSVVEDFAAIARLSRAGEPVAQQLLSRSARAVAAAAQSLANMIDVDLIVLTGPSFTSAGALYLPVIQAHLDATFFARDCHRVKVALSPNAVDAAAIGAAALVLQSELAPHMSAAAATDNRGSRPLSRQRLQPT